MEKVYVQTYSVMRDMMRDFKGTLAKIAGLGYTGVEFAGGYGGLQPAELDSLLKELGLEVISSHVGLQNAEDDIEILSYVGAPYMICPGPAPASEEEAHRTAARLNEIGEACAKAGMKYGYHNHTSEFMRFNGKYALDILMEETDPANVVFQLDVGWAACAGIDVEDYINKHAGRIELIHAKECNQVVGVIPILDHSRLPKDENGRPIIPEEIQAMHKAGTIANGPTGKGIIDWKSLRKTADAQGTKAYIVEREYDYQGDIYQCLKEDLDYLKTV